MGIPCLIHLCPACPALLPFFPSFKNLYFYEIGESSGIEEMEGGGGSQFFRMVIS